MSINLSYRCLLYLKMLQIFVPVLSCVALGDIRRDRYSCSLNLASKPVSFLDRERLAQFLDILDHVYSNLPHARILVATYCHASIPNL